MGKRLVTKCNCGKGYVSLWDNKCGNCRTKKEQRDHLHALANIDLIKNKTMHEAYNEMRKHIK